MGSGRAIRISQRDILFEDQRYLAVNKRRGWPVSAPADRPSVTASVRSFLRHRANGVEPALSLVRGLEAASSGVVLYALGEPREIDVVGTEQHAMCRGRSEGDSAELVDFLRKKRIGRKDVLVEVSAGGKRSVTRYRVVARRADELHVALEPVQGPTHHARAQLAAAGLPIIGDRTYGDAGASMDGMLLHTRCLRFIDRATGTTITIEAPLPDEFGEPSSVDDAPRYVLFYKPYGVLSQFTVIDEADRCLAEFDLPAGVYPVGRLDKDSEGLLLLTNDGRANARLSDPAYGKEKTYWVQVEGIPTDAALAKLEAGVVIRGYTTKPCRARRLEPPPALPERDPPIRVRKAIPTAWIEVVLTEGKNRQVRRMTAAVGHPTLRLVRARIDDLSLGDLRPGEFADVDGF